MRSNRSEDIPLIVFQIVLMQSWYYLFQIVLTYIITSLFGVYTHTGQIWSREIFTFPSESNYSWIALLSNSINWFIVAAWATAIVGKAREVLDFVATIYFFHFFFSWILYGFPYYVSWIVFNAIFWAGTTLVAEQVCMKIEMQEIKLDFSHIIGKGGESKKL